MKKYHIHVGVLFIIILILISSLLYIIDSYRDYNRPIEVIRIESMGDVYIIENNIYYLHDGNLYSYNIDDEKTKLILEGNPNNENKNPDFYKNKIVFERVLRGPWGREYSIQLYDLNKDQNYTIVRSAQIKYYDPVIYENNIVWIANFNGTSHIYIKDIKSGNIQKLPDDDNNQFSPSIHKNIITFSELNNDESDIFIYDLNKNKKEPLIQRPGRQISPKVFNSKIIWKETEVSGPWWSEIYVIDLETKEEKKITTSRMVQSFDIYNNRVVWEDWEQIYQSDDPGDIFLYDLEKNEKRSICTNQKRQWSPTIYKDTIVWGDNRNGYGSVYMYVIKDDVIFGLSLDEFIILMIIIIAILIIISIYLLIKIRRKRKSSKSSFNNENNNDGVISSEDNPIDFKQITSESQNLLCPNCNKPFKVSEIQRPIKVKCPHCGIEGEIK